MAFAVGAVPAKLTLKVTVSPSFTCTPPVALSRSMVAASTAAAKLRGDAALMAICTSALCSPTLLLRCTAPPAAPTAGFSARVTRNTSAMLSATASWVISMRRAALVSPAGIVRLPPASSM